MDTLKTGFIVVLLLAVLYGVYVVLNKDQTPPTAEIAWHQQEAERDLQIEMGPPAGETADLAASLGTPTASPGMPAAAEAGAARSSPALIGIPSVLRAELSPGSPADETTAPGARDPAAPVAVSQLPLSSSTPPAAPTTSQPGTSASALPPGTPTHATTWPSSSGPTVSAPSLLTATPDSTKPAATAADPRIDKPAEIPGLPSLRDSADTPRTGPAISETKPPLPESPTSTSSSSPSSPPASEKLAGSAPPLPSGPSSDVPAAPALPGQGLADSTLDPKEAPAAPSIERTKPISTGAAFDAALREAHANLAAERWYPALFLMSKFYDSPDLTSQQHQQLLDLLDPLAAKVIYSPEHLVTDAHEVQRGETLAQIAEQNQIPPQLLANINGIDNPDVLLPGTRLKIVRGPFRADVRLGKKEITLFAGQLYAGRFPISVGKDPEPQVGEFRVLEKQPGKVYYAGAGQTIGPDDPQNPFGRVWIGLGKELAIHGSAEQGDDGSLGCISLSPLDAQDVYGILSQGSSVTIRR